MRHNLVQIELRCKEHESEDPDCPGCRYVRRFESEFEQLRERRDELITELKRKLRRGRVILIDIR